MLDAACAAIFFCTVLVLATADSSVELDMSEVLPWSPLQVVGIRSNNTFMSLLRAGFLDEEPTEADCRNEFDEDRKTIQEFIAPEKEEKTKAILLQYYLCLSGDAAKVAKCTENKTASEIETHDIAECAGIASLDTKSEKYIACAQTMSHQFVRLEPDLASLEDKAFGEICQLDDRPLCNVVEYIPGAEKGVMMCIPNHCTLELFKKFLQSSLSLEEKCILDDDACSITVDCSNSGPHASLWFEIGLVIVVVCVGIVGFVMWRKKVNTQ